VLAALAKQFEDERVGGLLESARLRAEVLDVLLPEGAGAREAALRQAREAMALVETGRERELAGQWLAPRGASAVAAYREALALVPGFGPAKAALASLEAKLVARAEDAKRRDDFGAAEEDLRRASRVGANPAAVQDARAALARQRAERAGRALEAAREAMDRLDLPGAAQRIAEARQADPQAPGLDEAVKRLAEVRRYGHFQPGQVFADAMSGGGDGPAMVVVPHGRFLMGAPDDEPGARDNERPQREVVFERGFALAVHEVSVEEFAAFIAATGYRTVAERRGRSTVYDERGGAMVELRGAHWRRSYLGRTAAAPRDPVLHVAYEDAQAYADWLSARTGQRYRLPSEAEFEYALRAGETGPWPWGRTVPARAPGNLTGEGDVSPQGRRWGRAIRGWSDGHWGPAPVGSYPSEGFGSRDLIGNVSEWVEDCWHDSYRRAPMDGRAWVNRGCTERVVRGGSWASTQEQARSAFRLQVPATLTSARIGFRVARDL
jgi:formylglycine-generating enzyme required for sulfatase activity